MFKLPKIKRRGEIGNQEPVGWGANGMAVLKSMTRSRYYLCNGVLRRLQNRVKVVGATSSLIAHVYAERVLLNHFPAESHEFIQGDKVINIPRIEGRPEYKAAYEATMKDLEEAVACLETGPCSKALERYLHHLSCELLDVVKKADYDSATEDESTDDERLIKREPLICHVGPEQSSSGSSSESSSESSSDSSSDSSSESSSDSSSKSHRRLARRKKTDPVRRIFVRSKGVCVTISVRKCGDVDIHLDE